MEVTDQQLTTLNRLQKRLHRDTKGYQNRLGFESLEAYYNGEQRLEQLGLAVPDELSRFVTIVAWPGTYIDAIVERQRVQGFVLAGGDKSDDELARVFRANHLETELQMGQVDSRVFGRSYLCAGSNDDDENTPLVTVESPLEMVHEWSNSKRAVTNAGRFYVNDSSGKRIRKATLYEDGRTTWLKSKVLGRWEIDEDDAPGVDEHGLPCPVVPMVNRPRTADRYGATEMRRIITLTDAAARALTNAQVATEVMAIPQRWAAGMVPSDFQDPKTKRVLTAWEAYFGAVWATQNPKARFGQFSAAELSNFKTIVGLYSQLVAGLTGLPMRYLGQLADNPPSADGIRADESRLIGTCEDKNLTDGDALVRMHRIVRRFQEPTDPKAADALAGLATLWRNPGTPTVAQSADAAVKKRQERIISLRQARRDCGYSEAEIKAMEEDDLREAQDPTTERIARELAGAGGAGGS